MITNEQVQAACRAYYSEENDTNYDSYELVDMRKALEAYEQSKPTRKPLSDDALLSIVEKYTVWNLASHAAVGRAIEQAHGIGVNE